MLKQYLFPMYPWRHFIQDWVSRLLKILWLLLLLKGLADDFIMIQENIKQTRKKLSAYSAYIPSHDVLHFFMTIKLTSIYIKMCSEIDVNSTSETWFPNKYIEDEIKKKVDITRGQLASD